MIRGLHTYGLIANVDGGLVVGIAIVNGKCVNSDNQVNVRNLMVQNGKITGIGYIPDEDEENIDIIDISQSLGISNNFDFLYAPSFKNLTQYLNVVQSWCI